MRASKHTGLTGGAAGVPALAGRQDPGVGHRDRPHPQEGRDARECDAGEGPPKVRGHPGL